MEQLHEKLVVLVPGDELPPGSEDYIKIFLAGSQDLSGADSFNWQSKFCMGLAKIIEEYKDSYGKYKYMVLNPNIPLQNNIATPENPEFIIKNDWIYEMLEIADVVFCNFLKKSVFALPMFEFGYLSRSQKLVVRCPGQYQNYPHVAYICNRFGIPLIPGQNGTILSVMEAMFGSVPKLIELEKLSMPE